MNKLMIYLLVLLSIVDIILTNIGLSFGSNELNLFMKPLITTWYGISIKICITALIAVYLYYRQAYKTFIGVNLFMFLICINNLIEVII